jgi:hypothetical protein
MSIGDGSGSRRFPSRRLARLAAAAVGLFVAGFVVAVLVWQFSGGGVWRGEVNLVEAPRRMAVVIAAAVLLLLAGSLAAVSPWRFFAVGVRRSKVSVAEAARHLVFLMVAAVAYLAVGFAVAVLAWQFFGGGVWRSEVGVFEAELRAPQRLVLLVKSCGGDPEVTLLRETDINVQVKLIASSTPLTGGGDCLDLIEIQLQEPLGDRVVIDKHTGQSVSFRTVN